MEELDSFLHFASERAMGGGFTRKGYYAKFNVETILRVVGELDSFLRFTTERAMGVALQRKPRSLRALFFRFASKPMRALLLRKTKKPAISSWFSL
ncbi:hypothetical protein [Arenibacter echinorum]|uniref:hypothetical protein n=1 Tax=Arenibacter echinorum TaxID=440515 RepID=UPI000DBA906D|nr:hypothetical protein [Arenibacter echinorum]